MGHLAALAQGQSVKTIEDLVTAETKIRAAAGSKLATTKNGDEATLRTQIKGLVAYLKTAPKRRETKMTGNMPPTHFTVYDMGEGQESDSPQTG